MLGEGPEDFDGSMFGFYLKKQREEDFEAERPNVPDVLPKEGEIADDGSCPNRAKWQRELKLIDEKLAPIR